MRRNPDTGQILSEEDLRQRVDSLMAEADTLSDRGLQGDADTLIAEAENLEDLFSEEWNDTP